MIELAPPDTTLEDGLSDDQERSNASEDYIKANGSNKETSTGFSGGEELGDSDDELLLDPSNIYTAGVEDSPDFQKSSTLVMRAQEIKCIEQKYILLITGTKNLLKNGSS